MMRFVPVVLLVCLSGCYTSEKIRMLECDACADDSPYTWPDDPVPPAEPIPRRVLYLVDVSASMSVVDPPEVESGETRRNRAIRAAIHELLSDRMFDTAISIVAFAFDARLLTFADFNGDGAYSENESMFVDDESFLVGSDGRSGVLELLLREGTSSRYRNAYLLAQQVVEEELARTSASDRARMMIEVVTVGDFGVFASDEEGVAERAVVDEVRRLVETASRNGAENITVNSAHMETGTPAADDAGWQLATLIADVGLGTARSFTLDEELDLLFED